MKNSNPSSPDLQIVQVHASQGAYPVYLGHGLLGERSLWDQHLSKGKVLLVSNAVVAPLYLDRVRSALNHRDLGVHIIPDGEQFKTTETWSAILDELIAMKAKRDASIIALGGGVVGDISGFAAAAYMRGIRFLQAPTTLLAQVDASVGGKTGINHQHGKNLIGAFHQPAAVIIDTSTLATLQVREFAAGMAEVVKYGAIMNEPLFGWLEVNSEAVMRHDANALQHLVKESVSDKAKVVAEDELEAGIRAILNFGHSFGHALETATRYEMFLHGEAVAIGMVIASHLSEMRGLCATGTALRIERLLSRFGLPVALPAVVSNQSLVDALELDKKALSTGLRLILLHEIGRAVIDDGSSSKEILAALDRCRGSKPTIGAACHASQE